MNTIEIGKKIEELTRDLIEQVSIAYPKKWETYSKKILNGDLSITTNEKIIDLYRQICELEKMSNNPYIDFLKVNNKK